MKRKLLIGLVFFVLLWQVLEVIYFTHFFDPKFDPEDAAFYNEKSFNFFIVGPLFVAIALSLVNLVFRFTRSAFPRAIIGAVNAGWFLLWLGVCLLAYDWVFVFIVAPHILGGFFGLLLALTTSKSQVSL